MRMDWEVVLEPNGDGTQVTQQCEMISPEDSPFKNMVDAAQVERSSAEAMANLELLKQVVER